MDPTQLKTSLNRLTRRRLLTLLASAGAGGAIIACTGSDKDDAGTTAVQGATATATPADSTVSTGATEIADTSSELERPAGWAEASHSNDAQPAYDIVFPRDRVNQITFTVSPEDWQAMLDNMTELAGPRGSGQGGGAGGPANGGAPQPGGQPGGGQPGGGPGGFIAENPMWVPATVSFQGLQWTNVGLRFKGNSSLRSAWNGGTDKMPFKLDFDEFEDDFPEIDGQRFYGFKQLSLSNNWGDASAMRESLAYDLLEAAGLVAAETGFYEVVLERGEGPQSLGLYTVIEVVDDTVVRRHFDDDSGNIYKPEGAAASFAEGTQGQIEAGFQVESDEDKADWSDIRALYDVLHDDLRFADAQAWRERLGSVFEVEPFLEWLALSALLQHWDTYGAMTHNYYLYNDPQTGRLNWISWDHNLILGAAGGGGGPAGGGGASGRSNVSFDKGSVGDDWPLIGFLLTQPEYAQKYNAYLGELMAGAFEPSAVIARIEVNAALLEPMSGSNAAYAEAVESLKSAVQQRVVAAQDYLASL